MKNRKSFQNLSLASDLVSTNGLDDAVVAEVGIVVTVTVFSKATFLVWPTSVSSKHNVDSYGRLRLTPVVATEAYECYDIAEYENAEQRVREYDVHVEVDGVGTLGAVRRPHKVLVVEPVVAVF